MYLYLSASSLQTLYMTCQFSTAVQIVEAIKVVTVDGTGGERESS